MRAAPNLGPEYRAAFDRDLSELRRQLTTSRSIRSFSTAWPRDPKLNQPDGLHPTAEGVEVIVARILPAVEALLKQAKR